MKKILLVIFLFLGFSPSVYAQAEYGVIGGINFGYFNKVPPLGDAVSSFGYMLGIRGSFGSNLFFEPAIEYASYGSTILLNDGTDHKMRSNYIRVPLQVGAKVFDEAPINIEVRAGLSESFLLSYSDEITAGSGPAFSKSDVNLMRTGAIIGGGVRVFFLKFDLEYEWGLTDFFKSTGGSTFRALYLILGGNF